MPHHHPILEDLQWRYTSKKYDPARKVSKEDLNVLLETLRLTPSSINSQPWKFVVLESEEAKARMAGTFSSKFQFNRPHITESSHTILFAYNPHYARKNYEAVVDQAVADGRVKAEERDAAFAPFVFAELNTDKDGNNVNWTKAQLYITLGNALHTLARLRIDSTPMEGIDVYLVNAEFAKELNGYQCAFALTIGYSHPEGDYNATLPKTRLKAEKVIVRV